MNARGYGKTLEVNLSTGKTAIADIDPEFGRKYIGGIGFGQKILYDEVGLDTDPYSPENIIIFANGPLTGTHAPSGGRTEIVTKHPLSGGIGTGNTGGVWGAKLKKAGFDIIITRGRADKPTYLLIDDGKVMIKDAAHLWGKDARLTTDILRDELSRDFAVLAIGQAGENLVRYACPLNDYYHVAGRCGAGGVMGSKNLKAIAVRGTGTPQAARPAEFQKVVEESRERLRTADKIWWKPQASLSMEVFHRPGEKPGLGRADQLKYVTGKREVCYACPMNCYNEMGRVKEGKYAGLHESNVTRSLVIGVFSGLGIDNLPAVWKCKDLSQRYGMDYESSTRLIGFAMELYKQGIITKKDTDGIELVRGNEEGIMEMLRKIACREGIGDILADGSVRAAQKFGKGTEKYITTIKGMEGGRATGKPGGNWWFIGGFTNPRGDITTSTHWTAAQYNPDWTIDEYDMFDDVKKKIYSMPPEQVSATWEGKAMMLKWFEDLHSLVDALGLCFFPTHMRMAMGPRYASRLFSAYTGIDVSPEEMAQAGDRLFNLFKAHIVRQGLTRKDDYSPKESDSEADVKQFNKFLDEYYALRGWDAALSAPTKAKLEELGMNDIADDLQKLGRLPKRQIV